MGKVIIAALKTLLSLMKDSTEFLGSQKTQSELIESLFGMTNEVPLTMVDIELRRFAYHPDGTLGVIDIAGERFWTIERPWLDNKPNVSCIPEGKYRTGWRDSPRFGETWHVKDVEERTWILIHAANYPKDVQGCIGLGTGLMADRVAVSNSRKAVAQFEKLTRDIEWLLIVKHAPHAGLSKT